MSQIQKYVVVAALALLVGFGLHSWTSHAGLFTGFNSINLVPNSGDSYLIANNGVPIIGTDSTIYSSSSIQIASTSLVNGTSTVGGLQIDSGATIQRSDCGTNASFNPGSISSSTDASTTIALTGAVAGDVLVASVATTTSGQDWYAVANLSAAGTVASATLVLKPVVGSPAYFDGLNLATATARVCYFGY